MSAKKDLNLATRLIPRVSAHSSFGKCKMRMELQSQRTLYAPGQYELFLQNAVIRPTYTVPASPLPGYSLGIQPATRQTQEPTRRKSSEKPASQETRAHGGLPGLSP